MWALWRLPFPWIPFSYLVHGESALGLVGVIVKIMQMTQVSSDFIRKAISSGAQT